MHHKSISKHTFLMSFCAVALILASTPLAIAQTVSFRMNESFLRIMVDRDTIQPVFRVKMEAHGPLHTLDNDCEMHIAGKVQNASPGTPSGMVVEFPNWCKFSPDGQLGVPNLGTVWADLVESRVIGQNCDVKGFLRIFCEHCQGGSPGGSNPDHAYEFHPALSMTCGSDSFDFNNMLRTFPGLRHISPSTAANCIQGRELRVRFKNNRYEFAESGGGSCGNFAVVQVTDINLDWSFAIEGGHYSFADVTADGQGVGGIGLYTFTGSNADTWLAQAIQQGGVGNSGKVVHGVFTYDWQSIFDTLLDTQGNLRKPVQWQRIDFPLALIVYGETTAPF
jgi:hypothetical protein